MIPPGVFHMSASSKAHIKETYEFGPFRVDPDKETLHRDGEPVPLTHKTFQILLVLIRNNKEVVTKDDLMKTVWPDTFVEEANLSRNIFMLRKALGESPQDHRYIVTVPGQGYRLAESVRVVADQEVTIIAANRTMMQVQVRETKSWVWIALAALLMVAVVAATVGFFMHRGPLLSEKDTIVLADFQNNTGDPIFDGTLRQGLAVQLEQSPFLSLVSDQQIQHTLRMMSRSPDARVTANNAREICERIGSTAVLDGSISSIGSQYVLGLRATNCRTGASLAQVQTRASGKEDLLAAMDKAALEMRGKLGESLTTVEQHSTPLAEATTTSLEALKAYSEGWKVHASSGAAAALPLFQRATEIDPQFAMAHAVLGRMYADIDEPGYSAESTSKAYQLRDRASDRERFWITAAYETLVTGNLEKAQQTCELWIQAYPRDVFPRSFLAGMIYPVAGKYEIAVDEAKRAIEFDPDLGIAYHILAARYQNLDRLKEAESAIQQAYSRQLRVPELLGAEYEIAFLRNDPAGMDRVAALSQRTSGTEAWLLNLQALTFAYRGQRQQARNISRRALDLAQQGGQPERAALWEISTAVWEALLGNQTQARQTAIAARQLATNSEVEYGTAVVLALAGNSSGSKRLADDLEKRFPEDTSVKFSYLPTLRALFALNQRQPSNAIELLQTAIPHELGKPRSSTHAFFGALYPVYVRGEAYLALHKGPEAAAEFQKILDHRGVVTYETIGALAQLQLGRAVVLSGDKTKARAAYQDFLNLWKNADPDMPTLKRAKTEYAKLQ
jgi:eukaryotic-like serine/threonine-protein kinase